MGIGNWGNTVSIRQLEALIRLSEANAKLTMADEVTNADVIVAVQMMRQNSVVTRKAEVSLSGSLDSSLDKQEKLVLTYEEYAKICSAVLIYMKEENMTKTKEELVRWYVNELSIAGLLADSEDTLKKIKIAKKVLERMVKVDHLL